MQDLKKKGKYSNSIKKRLTKLLMISKISGMLAIFVTVLSVYYGFFIHERTETINHLIDFTKTKVHPLI